MKRLLLIINLIFISITSFAQRYDNTRLSDLFRLPNGEEIGESLIIAIPLLIIGFLIAYVTMWSKANQEKSDNEFSYVGCGGIILMIIGFVLLLPLLAWVEVIGMVLVDIAIVIGIIILIISFFKKGS